MEEKKFCDETLEAHSLADDILKSCAVLRVSPNIAQAALGSAWVRLCRGMGFTVTEFREILNSLNDSYDSLSAIGEKK